MADRQKVLLCKIMGVEGDFGLRYDPKFLSLALYYLRAYACTDPSIAERFSFPIRSFPISKTDEEIVEVIFSESPQIVAFSAYLPEVVRTTAICKKIKFIMPDTTIIIGGPSIGDSKTFLEKHSYIDIVVRAEGEVPFRNVLRSFIEKTPLGDVRGITFRSDKKVVKNPDAPLDFDVNTLPFIFTDEFIDGTSGIATCETTRGCRNHCRFCGIGRSITRNYDMDRIESDLRQIFSNKNIRRLFIGDSDFFSDRRRAVAMLDIIKKYNAHKTQIEFYSDFLGADEELLKECRAAYIHDSLRVPLQTLTENALKESHREWFDFDLVKKNAQAVLKYFPSTNAELIYGLPGDNYEGMKRSLRWCAEIGLINPKLHRLQNLPGSAYTRHSEKYGLKADPNPPHYVYFSDTFSYDDSLKAEALSRNLQTIFKFIFPADYGIFSALGIDLFDTAENIHTDVKEWDDSYVRASEANVTEAKWEAAEILLGYFSRKYSTDIASIDFLRDIFRYRWIANNLYNYFRESILYNSEIDTLQSGCKGAFIPRYETCEISHNIPHVIDVNNLSEYMKQRRQKFYLLYSHSEPGIMPVKVRNHEIFAESLRHFDGSSPDIQLITEKIVSGGNAAPDDVVPLITRLFERGFVFYAEPEYVLNEFHKKGSSES